MGRNLQKTKDRITSNRQRRERVLDRSEYRFLTAKYAGATASVARKLNRSFHGILQPLPVLPEIRPQVASLLQPFEYRLDV